MVATIVTLRGSNAKPLFWISAILYASLGMGIIVLAVYADSVSEYGVFSMLLNMLYLLLGFGGLVAPIIGWVIRKRNPALFKKPVPGTATSPSNIPVTPKPQHSAQEQRPSGAETAVQQPEAEPAVVTQPKLEPSHIFVCYRRSDSADIAGRIYDRLIGKFGKDPIFKDVDSIPLGLDFKEYLDMKVGECDVFLAIIGDEWLTASDATGKRRIDDPTDFVRIEIESALQRKIPVIPLLVRDAHMPREEDLPPSLRTLVYRNGTPIRSDPDFHRDMDRLIAYLEKYINKDIST